MAPPKIQRQEHASGRSCVNPEPSPSLARAPLPTFPSPLPASAQASTQSFPMHSLWGRKEPTYQGYRNAPTESPKTIIPRALLRSYKERLHHLCKVTEAFLPRASSSPYIGDLDALSEGLTALMLRGILAIYNKRIGGGEERRSSRPRSGTSLPSCARETYYRRT